MREFLEKKLEELEGQITHLAREIAETIELGENPAEELFKIAPLYVARDAFRMTMEELVRLEGKGFQLVEVMNKSKYRLYSVQVDEYGDHPEAVLRSEDGNLKVARH